MAHSKQSITTKILPVALSVATALSANQVFAVEVSNEQKEQEVEKIVVTGSLINRQMVYEGKAPIQTLDNEILTASGISQTSDALKNLTVNTGSTLAIEQSEAQGTSQFSLRGLGLGSSLTLINGRRGGVAPVTNGAGNFFFDINSLPVNMIERIDVMTDGASATYGSEAVAGVANIVTRQMDGFEVSGGYSTASNVSQNLGIAFGEEGEKGAFSVFATHYRQDHNFRTDFDWVVDRVTMPGGDIFSGRHTSGTGSPGSYTLAVLDPASGLYDEAPNGIQVPDANCEAAGGYLKGDTCRMSFADQRTIIPDEARTQVFATGNYEFDNGVNFFIELGYSVNKITDRVGAFVFDNGNLATGEGFHIPGDHPFNFWVEDPSTPGGLMYVDPSNPGWADGTLQAADLAATARPLGDEVNGDNAGKLEREFKNTRILTGLQFDITEDWAGTATYMHSDNTFTEIEPHNYIVPEFTRLVEEGLWNPFGTRLTNPDLVSPKNGATAGNSPDIQQLFDSYGVQRRQTKNTVAELLISGDLMEIDAGFVPLAMGIQYRNLEYDRTPDSLEAAQLGNRAAREFRVSGKQDVYAIFAETIVPVGDTGELQFAARYEDYGDGVDTFDPKIAGEFEITDWLNVRGSWGTSFQAPTLTQVAGEQTFGTLTDFEVRENGQSVCRQSSTENTNTVQKRVGSESLKPQHAQNLNLGFLLAPTENLDVSIDFWHYQYEDLIGVDANGQSLVNSTCYNADGSFREGQAPIESDRVQRNAAGWLVSTTSNFINIGEVEAQGIDLSATYRMDTDEIGRFVFDAKATLGTAFDADVDGDGVFEDRLGYRNSDLDAFAPQPKLRWTFTTSWNMDNHRANLAFRYIDSFKQDENPTQPMADVDSWLTLDAQYSYTFEQLIGSGSTNVMIGANNLTDQDPPALVGAGVIRPGYEGTIHDIRGRQVYVKFKHTF